jgi:hypothetical protein
MKIPDPSLVTPLYVKLKEDMPWPEDSVFYVLASDGLFLCRNFRFYRSCVPARGFPRELAKQRKFLRVRYPRVPRELLEQAVGFFAEVADRHNAEASVVLAVDTGTDRVHLLVPEQRATVYKSWYGNQYPVGVHYDLPSPLPEGWLIFGDIHSHVDGAAYASYTDKADERYRAGLHIVVGRIRREPPEFHVEATVDGARFHVDPAYVLEGYEKRATEVDPGWHDKVEVEVEKSGTSGWTAYGGSYGGAYGGTAHYYTPDTGNRDATRWRDDD